MLKEARVLNKGHGIRPPYSVLYSIRSMTSPCVVVICTVVWESDAVAYLTYACGE